LNVTECPQCGAPADQSQKSCEFCKAPFVINSLGSIANFDKNGIEKYLQVFKNNKSQGDEVETILGLGLCYLNLKNYTLANIQFKKLVDLAPELAEGYYYLALCIIKGRRLKTLTLKEIKEIEELIVTAQQIDTSAYKYDALLAALKHDYYRTNGMRIASPDENEILSAASNKALDEDEIRSLIDQILLRDEGIIGKLLRT